MADNKQLEEPESKESNEPHHYSTPGSDGSMKISLMFAKRFVAPARGGGLSE